MRILKLDSLAESILWTYRSWKYGCPIPKNIESWKSTCDFADLDKYRAEIQRTGCMWAFLGPFFASHGYHLYESSFERGLFAKPPSKIQPFSKDDLDPYPYARRIYCDEEELNFSALQCMRIWPARDIEGHEVMVRLVSGSEPSDELKVYQRLNTSEARSDPRNHTLPVLDFLRFDGWEIAAMCGFTWFNSISEILDLAEAFYEGLIFPHENRIAHGDILEQNTVMNVLMDPAVHFGTTALRAPEVVRYAYIDFDSSIIFPEGTDIDTVSAERNLRLTHSNLHMREGLCNPFKDDVRYLSFVMQRHVRHTEDVVPEIASFLEDILKCECLNTPSASQCLDSLRQLRSNLSKSQLEQAPCGLFWEAGKITFRDASLSFWEQASQAAKDGKAA